MRTIWEFLSEKLGMNDLRGDLNVLEKRIESLETFKKLTTSSLQGFGKKIVKKDGELEIMKSQINNILDAVVSIMDILETKEQIKDARSLISRLKNHRTRIERILKERMAIGG